MPAVGRQRIKDDNLFGTQQTLAHCGAETPHAFYLNVGKADHAGGLNTPVKFDLD
jgi:hypothetical protein